jgi:AraC-like DNA-binding protein
LVTIWDGRGTVRVDDHQYRLKPEQAVLVLPGQQVSWRLPKNSYVETIAFDCAVRQRHRPNDDQRLAAVEEDYDRSIEEFFGQAIGPVFRDDVGQRLCRAVRDLGDLWWRSVADRLLADARLAAMLAELYDRDVSEKSGHEAEPWEAVHHWAERRLEHGVTVADMADYVGMERSAFTRAHQRDLGFSPGQYLRDRRVVRARHLLATTQEPLGSIATHSGYRSRAAFVSAFTTAVGCSPSQWRIQERAAWQGGPHPRKKRAVPTKPEAVRPKIRASSQLCGSRSFLCWRRYSRMTANGGFIGA